MFMKGSLKMEREKETDVYILRTARSLLKANSLRINLSMKPIKSFSESQKEKLSKTKLLIQKLRSQIQRQCRPSLRMRKI